MTDAPDPSEGRDLYGRDPAAYDLGRPPYPERVWQVLESRCDLRARSRVVEIGPGTGLVTRRLLAMGAEVTAVEPNAAMVAHLEEHLGAPSLAVIHAPFEDAPLGEEVFDLAVAATSFHWVDGPRGRRALRRVVRRGGWVAIWWIIFENPADSDDFAEAAAPILGSSPAANVEPGRPRFQLDQPARRAELIDAGLVDVQSEIIAADIVMDAAQTRALYATMAILLRRSADEQASVLDALEDLVHRDFGGTVTRRFPTALYTARNP